MVFFLIKKKNKSVYKRKAQCLLEQNSLEWSRSQPAEEKACNYQTTGSRAPLTRTFHTGCRPGSPGPTNTTTNLNICLIISWLDSVFFFFPSVLPGVAEPKVSLPVLYQKEFSELKEGYGRLDWTPKLFSRTYFNSSCLKGKKKDLMQPMPQTTAKTHSWQIPTRATCTHPSNSLRLT